MGNRIELIKSRLSKVNNGKWSNEFIFNAKSDIEYLLKMIDEQHSIIMKLIKEEGEGEG